MERTRVVRGLRIAWSVAWGILCVLLVMLCVRSYWRLQILEKRSGSQAVQISSVIGRIAVAHLDPRITLGRSYLSVAAGDAADWRKGRVLGFAYHDDGLVRAFIAPHWLPALLAAALAVIPWYSWQFSLRTLLVATTLLAVVLGLAAWAGS
jgi:hypothetical protein